jgi:hypothetical protein
VASPRRHAGDERRGRRRAAPAGVLRDGGWPEEVLVAGRRILFAGGLYGLYAFDLDAFNLLAQR